MLIVIIYRKIKTNLFATKLIILFFLAAWMAENQYDAEFEHWPASMIDNMLQKFYAGLQTKDGKDYFKPSLVGLRAGINRHLMSPPYCRTINLMKDREFMTSNQVQNGLVKN